MPHYALAPGLTYGLVDGDPIFLDLAADLYFELDPPLRAAFDRLRNGNGTLPQTVAAGLLEAGIVRQSPASAPLGPASPYIPEDSLAGKELRAAARRPGGGSRWLAIALRIPSHCSISSAGDRCRPTCCSG